MRVICAFTQPIIGAFITDLGRHGKWVIVICSILAIRCQGIDEVRSPTTVDHILKGFLLRGIHFFIEDGEDFFNERHELVRRNSLSHE